MLKSTDVQHSGIMATQDIAGKSSQLVSKMEKGESSSLKTISQSDLNPMATLSSSQLILSQKRFIQLLNSC